MRMSRGTEGGGGLIGVLTNDGEVASGPEFGPAATALELHMVGWFQWTIGNGDRLVRCSLDRWREGRDSAGFLR